MWMHKWCITRHYAEEYEFIRIVWSEPRIGRLAVFAGIELWPSVERPNQ